MKPFKIVSLRLKNHWTQDMPRCLFRRQAKKIGITKQAYSNIETGKRKPSYKVIIELQNLFNATIDYLLEQEVDNINPISK